MSGIVHYEVYVYHNNTWDLLGRYPSEQRIQAIEYAKSVELSEHRPTKVVRETYNINTQTFLETMVYLSDIPKPQQKKAFPYTNSAIPVTVKQSPKKKSGLAEGIIMILMSIVFSMMASGMITVVILQIMSSIGLIPRGLTGQFVFGMFIFFFLIISISTSVKWVDWDELLEKEKKTPDHSTLLPSETKTSTYSERELYEIGDKKSDSESFIAKIIHQFFDFFDTLTGQKTFSQRMAEAQKKAQEEEKKAQEEEQKRLEEERKKQEEEQKRLEEERKKQEEEQESALKEKNEADTNVEKQDGTVIPEEIEREYLQLTTFLSIILHILQEQNTLLNTYTRFGIELFLAGACEQICRMRQLSDQQNRLMLSGLLELLGRTPALALLFYDKIEEYMLEPEYLSVIKNGAKSMEIYLKNKASPELINLIRSTMSNWLNPDKKDIVSGIYTIMFTDIVSSTHLTQTLGDKLAQQLVHRHNTIVREALSACNGEEIKQTGDGIMASFMWASNAIDAAIAIQQAVKTYNDSAPTVPLEIRIGLNAGEPIVENNDLFGLTVQIASRVCAQANKNQIYVSSVVKELAAGKNYTFRALGNFNLKGIDTPQSLYEVVWNNENPTQKENNLTEEKATPDTATETNLSDILPQL